MPNSLIECTKDTSQKVESVHKDCRAAADSMSLTMDRVSQLATDVAKSAVASGELAQEAERIGVVMQEIQGIAEQTNLLALICWLVKLGIKTLICRVKFVTLLIYPNITYYFEMDK